MRDSKGVRVPINRWRIIRPDCQVSTVTADIVQTDEGVLSFHNYQNEETILVASFNADQWAEVALIGEDDQPTYIQTAEQERDNLGFRRDSVSSRLEAKEGPKGNGRTKV